MLAYIIGGTMEIGDRLRVLLDVRDIGYNHLDRQVAQGSGYTSRLVRNEKKRPDMNIIRRIAEELEVDFEWLAFGRGQPPEDIEAALQNAMQFEPRKRGRPAQSADPAASGVTAISSPEAPHYEVDDRYPNRAAAIELLTGKSPPEVLRALQQLRLRSDQDWSVVEWMRQAVEFESHLIAWAAGELGPGDRAIDDLPTPNVPGPRQERASYSSSATNEPPKRKRSPRS